MERAAITTRHRDDKYRALANLSSSDNSSPPPFLFKATEYSPPKTPTSAFIHNQTHISCRLYEVDSRLQTYPALELPLHYSYHSAVSFRRSDVHLLYFNFSFSRYNIVPRSSWPTTCLQLTRSILPLSRHPILHTRPAKPPVKVHRGVTFSNQDPESDSIGQTVPAVDRAPTHFPSLHISRPTCYILLYVLRTTTFLDRLVRREKSLQRLFLGTSYWSRELTVAKVAYPGTRFRVSHPLTSSNSQKVWRE